LCTACRNFKKLGRAKVSRKATEFKEASLFVRIT